MGCAGCGRCWTNALRSFLLRWSNYQFRHLEESFSTALDSLRILLITLGGLTAANARWSLCCRHGPNKKAQNPCFVYCASGRSPVSASSVRREERRETKLFAFPPGEARHVAFVRLSSRVTDRQCEANDNDDTVLSLAAIGSSAILLRVSTHYHKAAAHSFDKTSSGNTLLFYTNYSIFLNVVTQNRYTQCSKV